MVPSRRFRQAQKGSRCKSGTVPAAVKSITVPYQYAIVPKGMRRQGPGPVRRPAIVKLNKRARGQVLV